VRFFAADGAPWRISVNGAAPAESATAVIPPRGTASLTTQDTGALAQGWAYVTLPCCPDIGGYVTFTQRVEGRPDFEATTLLSSSSSSRSVLWYDNAAGYSTGVALVNSSSFTTATITVAIRDEQGRRTGLDQFTVGRSSKLVFSLPEKYADTAGRRGSLEFTASPGSISVMGLRFNPGGAFTSVHSIEP